MTRTGLERSVWAMCTLTVATHVWDEIPLLIAANRDELITRPAAPPAVRVHRGTRIFAPKDLQAEGTWLGVNEHRIFAGITNRFAVDKREGVRSRGMLVLDALAEGSAEAARDRIAGIDAEKHNGFHLFIADRSHAFVVWNDGKRIHVDPLTPHVRAITERSYGQQPSPRERALERSLLTIAKGPPPDDEILFGLLTRHADDGLEGTCVHVTDWGYGTRSSTIVALYDDGRMRFLHADGPPCTSQYSDLSAQLSAILY